MAEVAAAPSLSRQLSLVMMVRWQTFRNGLRSRSEKAHLAGSLALGFFLVLLTLAASVGVGFAAYAVALTRNWLALTLMLWGIFVFWQLVPVLASEMNPGFDGRNLLRFPLRFSAFFLMSAAYGVADPFALTGIAWHVAIGIGVAMARPDLALWAALALIISIKMNLLLNRLVFAWLERALAKRRMRELVTAMFVLLFVCIQFSGIAVRRWGPQLRRGVENYATLWRSLPPGLPATVLQHAAAGESAAALRAAGLLVIYALVFGGLFALRVRAQFTGEDLGESAAPSPPKPAARSLSESAARSGAVTLQGSRPLSNVVSSPVAAIFVKEFRYFYRNTMLMMNVFMPLILIAFFSLSSSMPRRHGEPSYLGRFSGDFAYPGAVVYILLLMMNFCPNNLAYEGRGMERLFLAPVKFRDVMLGKNLFHGAILVMEALIALVLVTELGHPPRPVIILATWAALLFAALVHLAAGNWLSLQYPRRFEFGVRRQRPSGLTMIITFGLFLGELAVISIAAALCIWLARLWLLPLVYLVMSAAELVIYLLALEGTTRQAIRQRDTLLDQISR